MTVCLICTTEDRRVEKCDHMKGYNGWRNRETWNVSLWINNDEGLYSMAREHRGGYEAFAETLRACGLTDTPDGVAYNDSGLDTEALDDMLAELRGEGDDDEEN